MKTLHPHYLVFAIAAVLSLANPSVTIAEQSESTRQVVFDQIEEFMDQIHYFNGLRFAEGNLLEEATTQSELQTLSNDFENFSLSLTDGHNLSAEDWLKVEELTGQCFEALKQLQS